LGILIKIKLNINRKPILLNPYCMNLNMLLLTFCHINSKLKKINRFSMKSSTGWLPFKEWLFTSNCGDVFLLSAIGSCNLWSKSFAWLDSHHSWACAWWDWWKWFGSAFGYDIVFGILLITFQSNSCWCNSNAWFSSLNCVSSWETWSRCHA